MPVPSSIAPAAESFRMNSHFLESAVKDLAPEEWTRRPNETSNHMLWVVGHVIWARGGMLKRLGTSWSRPWFSLFARGVKLDDSGQYPSHDEATETWRESTGLLTRALEEISEDTLALPVTQPAPPTADGKNSGLVNFMAFHETYHVGQLVYIRSWLGHGRLMG